MIYAYDDWVQMPTKDLYDTPIMKMAIDAAKDMYDRGLTLMENFYKTYGDFMSPFAKDMEKYGSMMNNIRTTINDAYARGIDLFKSPEGRMLVQRLSHSIDPGWYNRAKANAKMGYAYLEALQEAKKNGTYDPTYENWMLNQEGGPGSFEEFSTDKKGMWTVAGPSKYQDANALVSPLFEDMKDDYIDTIDGYDISGVSRDRRELVLKANLGALLKTPNGRYHYEIAKLMAEQKYGANVTLKDILDEYGNYLLDASDRFEHRTRTENKDWARLRESQLRMKEDTHKTNEDIRAYKEQTLFDIDNGVSTSRGGSKQTQNVYQRTDTNGGGLTVFNPTEDVKERVTPIDGAIKREVYKDKESDDMVTYRVPNDLVPRVLFKQTGDKLVPMDVTETQAVQKHWFKNDTIEDTGSANFVSTGRMFSQKDKNGNTHYYITGYVSYGSKKRDNNGTADCIMEVSRPAN